jgi:glycosyltransferase involved in cell wall biosynthesis
MKIAFISTMDSSPWGASEELWSQTAIELVSRKCSVAASVHYRQPQHPRIQKLADKGVDVVVRDADFSLLQRVVRKARGRKDAFITGQIRKFLDRTGPALVVLSSGSNLPPTELMELCAARRQPFVTISHGNDDRWWPDDRLAEKCRRGLSAARRAYFVSNGNLSLLEKQLAFKIPNAEVVWSPVNVRYDSSPPFPPYTGAQELRLAAVGRLHPPTKGQDLLIQALAGEAWRERNWKLDFYGDGDTKGGLQSLINRYDLTNKIAFAGHVATEAIWAHNHALIMPSRFEGLPLTIIEAMLCGRAVAATNVGGNAEVILDDITGFITDAPTVSSIAALLERLWSRRAELEEMGKRGAQHIRQLAPPQPVQLFADSIQRMATA